MEQPERAQSHAARLPAATKLPGASCACPERKHRGEGAGGAGQREPGRHGSQRDVRSPTPEQLLCPRASARARLCGSASHQRVIETRAPSPVRATPSPAPLQERLVAPGLPGCATGWREAAGGQIAGATSAPRARARISPRLLLSRTNFGTGEGPRGFCCPSTQAHRHSGRVCATELRRARILANAAASCACREARRSARHHGGEVRGGSTAALRCGRAAMPLAGPVAGSRPLLQGAGALAKSVNPGSLSRCCSD